MISICHVVFARIKKVIGNGSGRYSNPIRPWSDVATPLVVGLLLSASYILPPSSNPASLVLVFLFICFLTLPLPLPFLTVILLQESVRSTSFVCMVFIVRMRDISSFGD